MIIQKNSSIPMYIQIYNQYKDAILSKTYPAYTKLLSIRQFGQKYSLSKTTVEKAYHQLQIEGYIQSQPKSGYYVLPIDTLPDTKKKTFKQTPSKTPYKNLAQQGHHFDVTPLRRSFQTVLHDLNETLYSPPLSQGEPHLRQSINTHLKEERGVVATDNQVLIASGLQNHLMTLASLISKRKIAYLIPLFDRAELALKTLHFTFVPCKTFDDLMQSDADFIYISPSNLYPSGDVLSINDRLKLIDYAKTNNALIIEDDYNHIFRYNAFQIPSIQGLAKGDRVIYIGSFSRNLLLSMRTSYMVLPPDLLSLYQKSDQLAQTVSKIDQLALANFIYEGNYHKHLRKLSSLSKKQNDRITTILDNLPLHKELTISGLESNLHLLIHTKNIVLKTTLIDKAKTLDLYIKTFNDLPNTLLLPYSGLSDDEIEPILHALLT